MQVYRQNIITKTMKYIIKLTQRPAIGQPLRAYTSAEMIEIFRRFDIFHAHRIITYIPQKCAVYTTFIVRVTGTAI